MRILKLIWSSEQDSYELLKPGIESRQVVVGWCADLALCSAFAFHGRQGHLTLRKERRQHSCEGYWYAYRNQGRKTLKRYVGRAADLSIARLEEIAATLNSAPGGPAVYMSHSSATTSPRQHIPLLAPKLSLPRLPATLLAREGLLTRLDAGLECKLTLLSAPAGFGKTTLACQWAAHLRRSPQQVAVAWVALDSGDNDPVRFWSYVITACQTFYGEAGELVLDPLRLLETAPYEQISLEVPLTLLLNELSRLPVRGVLVLEDYHVIDEPRIHASLAFLLDYLPALLHLVILTRTEPPLSLARLRAGGTLSEFGASDLRLSREETRAFLHQTSGISPMPETVDYLDALVEGWVTGLHLLTLALQGHENEQTLEQRLMNFSGRQRHLLEYFAGEVLATQPEEIQHFLLQTCLLNSFNASLCAAVTERTESEQILNELERANLFLLPLSGHERWYRYHPLFAEALRHEARQRLSPEAWLACSERACVWYELHGQLTEAIEAALAARTYARAAQLIEHITSPQRFHEMREHSTLQRWLQALPATVLQCHPALCLSFAMVLMFAHDCHKPLTEDVLAQVELPLRMAEQAWQAEENRGGLGEALAFRVVIARFQEDSVQAVHLARQALAWLPDDARQWRATCLSAIGAEEMEAGRLEAARQTLLEAYACFDLAGNHYGQRVILLLLAEICTFQGRLRESAAFYQEVLDMSGEDLADQGLALLGLAGLSYEWNDLVRAAALAQEALHIGTRVGDEALQVRALLVQARIWYASDQTTLADQQCATLLARAQTQPVPLLYREVFTCAARSQLMAGNPATAQRWLMWQTTHEAPLPLFQRESEQLLTARLLSVQGESNLALDLLATIRATAHRQGCVRDEMEALLLVALTLHIQHSADQAWPALSDALTLAHHEGYLRLFLDEGEPMAALLRAVLTLNEKGQNVNFLRPLLLAFSSQSVESGTPLVAPFIEPLSSQEQRVLHLLLAGFSNTEIAEAQVVSLNTIKSQVQSIYRKLNVHSRKEARQMMRAQKPS